MVSLRYAARSHTGLGTKSRNEDSAYAGPELLVLCDGMGGHAAGDVASSLVVGELVHLDGESHGADDMLDILESAVVAANEHLADVAGQTEALEGMGTTCIAMLRSGTKLAVANIGDSRAYLRRGQRVTQITKDHSFVQKLLDEGRISPDEALHHPQRALVTRVLTGRPEDHPDLSVRELRSGDRLLLCSDGLTDYVAEDTVAELLRDPGNPSQIADQLVAIALRASTRDNITVIVADVVPAGDGATKPQIVGAAGRRRPGESVAPMTPAEKAAALAREVHGDGVDAGPELAEEGSSTMATWLRRMAVALAIVLVTAGGAWATYDWSQRQYFVGEQDGLVTIFRGVSQDLGPLTLSRSEQQTDLQVLSLPEFYQERVRGTLTADDRPGADAIVAELRGLSLPPCADLADDLDAPPPAAPATPRPSRGLPPTTPARRRPRPPAPATSPTRPARPPYRTTRRRPAPRPSPTRRSPAWTACRDRPGDPPMTTISTANPRTGRGTELLLLAFACAIVLLAYVNLGLVTSGEVPANLVAHAVGLCAMALVFHLVVRWKAPYADPLMLPIATLLNGLGLVMILRLDLAVGRDPSSGTASRQLIWTALAVGAALAVLIVVKDHRVLRKFTFISMLAGFVLLLLPMLPVIGEAQNGARLWIRVGAFSFQPGELAKIAVTIFFAGYLVSTRDALSLVGRKVLGLQLPRGRDLGPLLVVWALSVLILVAQRDLGSSLLFFGIFIAMLYVATERVSWIVIGLGLFVGGAYVAWRLFAHVQSRVHLWLDPFAADQSDQVAKGLMGMGHGGLLGTGLGEGYPHLTYFANSDYIMASFGEELGLVGLFAILMLYALLAERGLRTAIGAREGFGKLLAVGLAFAVALQVFVVVGGITRVIPLTGLTTPFLSAGGSSLLANWIIVALLLRISDHARRPISERVTGPAVTTPTREVVAP